MNSYDNVNEINFIIFHSWGEVWKLRNLPNLTQLILSENPLGDVFYDPNDQGIDMEGDEIMDSPNITCHSDGEDSTVGSPQFK